MKFYSFLCLFLWLWVFVYGGFRSFFKLIYNIRLHSAVAEDEDYYIVFNQHSNPPIIFILANDPPLRIILAYMP